MIGWMPPQEAIPACSSCWVQAIPLALPASSLVAGSRTEAVKDELDEVPVV